MAQCLVTKLKASVSNSNLPFFNELRFFVNQVDGNPQMGTNVIKITIKPSSDIIIKDVSGYDSIKIYDSAPTASDNIPSSGFSNEANIQPVSEIIERYICVNNINTEIVIIPKKSISRIEGIGGGSYNKNWGFSDLSQLNYCPINIYVSNVKAKGIWDNKLSSSEFTRDTIYMPCFGDTLQPSGININHLPAGNYGQFNIKGHMFSTGDFGAFLLRLAGAGYMIVDYSSVVGTGVTGALEDVIMALKAANVTSRVLGISSYITKEGVAVEGGTKTFVTADGGTTYAVKTSGGTTLYTYNTVTQQWV